MTRRSRLGLGCAVSAMTLLQTPGFAADRPDNISKAYVYAREECPVTPSAVLEAETKAGRLEFLGPILGALLATVVGDAVKAGANAAGDALEAASREEGYGVEGRTWYYSSKLLARTDSSKTARIARRPTCLILFTQDDKGGLLADFPKSLSEDSILSNALGRDGKSSPILSGGKTSILEEMAKRGAVREPGLYVETRVLTSDEGVVIRPVFIRYARVMADAPRDPSAAELHVTLAVPGGTETGTPYSTVRLPLPKLRPGQTLEWAELATSASPMLVNRPTTGLVDDSLVTANAAYAAESTRKRERAIAFRELRLAERRLSVKPGDLDLKVARDSAAEGLKDAETALSEASDQANTISDKPLGATNASMRFIVIRAPNKFGLALAKALKGQAENLGTAAKGAVTNAVTAKPEWTADDTAYVAAQAALAGKQREYDAALAGGDSATLAKLSEELTLAKAKLNEAAVAIRRPIPYPGLM